MSVIKREWLANEEYDPNPPHEISAMHVRWITSDRQDHQWIVPTNSTACGCVRSDIETRHVGLGGEKQYIFTQTIPYSASGCECTFGHHKELFEEWKELKINSKYPQGKPFPVNASVMK